MAQKYPQPVRVRHSVVVAWPENPTYPVAILLRFEGAGIDQPVAVPLTLGEAHALTGDLVATVNGLLAGQQRPWDDDPGRTPFGTRGRRRSRAPRPAADRPGAPPPPASRPIRGVDSAA